MRPVAAALLAALLAAAGCSDPCKDLGNRLCDCSPVGVTQASCRQGVSTEISRLHPGKDVQDVCSQKLDTCHAPEGVTFCDWLEGRCGKAGCGMSEEDLQALRDEGICQ